MGHVVTAEWLHAHGTRGAGWTAEQLRAIGVTWPPRRGWIRQQEGREITDAQREAFEQSGARRD